MVKGRLERDIVAANAEQRRSPIAICFEIRPDLSFFLWHQDRFNQRDGNPIKN
jgi:hypothetical protein